jgi:hypothetical protein
MPLPRLQVRAGLAYAVPVIAVVEPGGNMLARLAV